MAEIDDIVGYYTNLLIIQYHNKPKAQAMVDLMVRELLAEDILMQIRDAYNIDTAVGVQLDVIGKYVGVDRFYQAQVFENYFSFINYAEVPSPPVDRIGFAIYADFATKVGRFLSYDNVVSTTFALTDDNYRILIRLKIIQNNTNHSHKTINDAIYQFFGNTVYPDSPGNMVMFYFVSTAAAAIVQVALQKDLLPRPMGVRLSYVITFTSPFFGFATYDGYSPLITGFANYADYTTKDGETLNYSKLLEA